MHTSSEPIPITLQRIAEQAPADRGYSFLEDDGVKSQFFSFTDLAMMASRFGAALIRHGLKKGDRVALIIPEQKTFAFSFLGAMHAGMIPVPVFPPQGLGAFNHYLERVRHILIKADVKMILTDDSIKKVLGSLLSKSLRLIISEKDLHVDETGMDLNSNASDKLAFIQFTSGSTKTPRGVSVLHSNLSAHAQCIMFEGLKVTPEDRGCTWLPFYHDMGLIGCILTPIVSATPVDFLPPLLFLKRPEVWLRHITQQKGSISFGPNSAYAHCVKRIKPSDMEELDLSTWRVAGCGAEPIHLSTLTDFTEKFQAVGFRKEAFLPTYGLAEATLAVTFAHLDRPPMGDSIQVEDMTEKGLATPALQGEKHRVTFVNCGKVFSGHELRIIDKKGNPCPERQIGEIVTRGPSITSGYFNDVPASSKTFRDGWLYTGDLGYLVNQDLYVCDRIKDLIIVLGKNYYPSDLESAASSVVGVRKGCVAAFSVSSPENEYGRVVVCTETRLTPNHYEELKEKIQKRILLDIGLRIDDAVMLSAGTLPKTSSGKIQRHACMERYLSNTLHPVKKGTSLEKLKQLMYSQLAYLPHRLRRGVR